RMKMRHLPILLLTSTAHAARPPAAGLVPPAVVLDGAPAPTPALRERLLPYMNARAAEFQDWSADGKSLYITTRFASTSQLHRLDSPGGCRRQLTFFDEPVRRARVSRAAGAPFVVF